MRDMEIAEVGVDLRSNGPPKSVSRICFALNGEKT